METETNRRRRELAKVHKGGKTVYVDWIRVRVIYQPPSVVKPPHNIIYMMHALDLI